CVVYTPQPHTCSTQWRSADAVDDDDDEEEEEDGDGNGNVHCRFSLAPSLSHRYWRCLLS
ncbi:hypothetical protein RDWZM_009990, partial [Blomia tropicalis]